MRIAAIYPTKEGATVHYRFRIPFKYFKEFEVVDYFIPSFDPKDGSKYHDFVHKTLMEFISSIKEEVVLVHRTTYVNLVICEILKKKFNKIIIFDTDDLESDLPPDHPLKFNYPKEEIVKYQKEISNFVKEIWVTTSSLRKGIINNCQSDKVVVIHNTVDHNEPQFLTKKKSNEILTIGWVGSVTHLPDLPICVEGFKKYFNSNHCSFLLKFCGVPIKENTILRVFNKVIISPVFEGDNYEIKVKKIFSFLPNEVFSMWKVLPIDQYAIFYDDMDVVIAPLTSNVFNDAKSELKILESGIKKIPIICSNSKTYYEFHKKFGNILLAYDSVDWFKSLKRLSNSKQLREDLGNQLYQIVRENYDVQYWATYREERIKLLLEKA